MENNDRHYSTETIFIRQRLGQQFTMEGPVLDKNGRISHRRFDFGTQTHESFVENRKLFLLFKDQFAGFNVALFSYEGQCRVVCQSGSSWGSGFGDYFLDNPFQLLKEEGNCQCSRALAAFDVTGMGTVEIIQVSIKKCQILATLFADLRDARI